MPFVTGCGLVVLFCAGCPSPGDGKPAQTPAAIPPTARHEELVVLAAQQIIELKVGECRDANGVSPDVYARVLWTEAYTKDPSLRAGNPFIVLNPKEKPLPIIDKFGVYYERAVLSPGIEVGLDLLPAPRKLGDQQTTGRLWASYRELEIRAEVGLPRWKDFGLFGAVFSASDYSGTQNRLVKLPQEELEREVPCQVLQRILPRDGKRSGSFFSLPVDMSPDGSFDEFFEVDIGSRKRVWSSFQSGDGSRWLMWCRLAENGVDAIIRQCRYDTVKEPEGRFWIWKRRSDVKSFPRKVGDRHVIGDLSFTIAEIQRNEANPHVGWIHISNPELKEFVPPTEK